MYGMGEALGEAEAGCRRLRRKAKKLRKAVRYLYRIVRNGDMECITKEGKQHINRMLEIRALLMVKL